MRTSGFSLIELLVVVAIIGILGGVGIVGYQAYISQTQDATTKDNFEFLKRTLDQDIVLVSNELGRSQQILRGSNKGEQMLRVALPLHQGHESGAEAECADKSANCHLSGDFWWRERLINMSIIYIMRQTWLRHLFSLPFVSYKDQTAFNRYQR